MISDRLWRSRYSGDRSIVGKPLSFNDTPYTIVGVMPPKFHFPDEVEVWQRLRWDLTQHSRAAHFMEAVARLAPDTTFEQAESAVRIATGGQGGIRTHDTLLTYTHFPGARHRPLGHLSGGRGP